MATQSCGEGCKTPVTVTVTNSSSERSELLLTLIFRKGFRKGQSDKYFLFNTLKFDIAVWLRCSRVELTIAGDRNDSEEEKPKNKQTHKINISFETGELIEGEASIGVAQKESRKLKLIFNITVVSGYVIFLETKQKFAVLFFSVFPRTKGCK